MKIIRVTYIALTTLFSVASCSQEATETAVYDWADGKIYFRTFLSDVASSRAQDMTLDRLESFQVTCFNTADRVKDASGFLEPYFENATFIRKTNSAYGSEFVSSPAEGPREWPANGGYLRFFAFSPSLVVMAEDNSAVTADDIRDCFKLINTSVESGSSDNLGYRLGNVRINPDISRQFDFVTADAAGERWKDFTAGVNLSFSHQLCQVELQAWGSGSKHNFEIAGVRIGNPSMKGTYVFAEDAKRGVAGSWILPEEASKGKVEYCYRASAAADVNETDGAGDMICRINNMEHNTADHAASIMGRGGCAMVIPTVNAKWEGRDDPNIADVQYSTDRMYISILTRVTDADSGVVIYPYPGNPDDMAVVSYAVDASGLIKARLYAGKDEGEYFLDSQLKIPYVAADGEETMDFGWAAVPVDADWKAGKRYVYTLNYSEGIGLHDPDDPEPGTPISGKVPAISWGVSVENWDYAEKDDNFDPDLEVPGEN